MLEEVRIMAKRESVCVEGRDGGGGGERAKGKR